MGCYPNWSTILTTELYKEKMTETLVSLAREIELTDPIDWGTLSVTEEQAYQMMASQVVEQFEDTPEDHRVVVAMATITRLLVENFVLNIKLQTMFSKRN